MEPPSSIYEGYDAGLFDDITLDGGIECPQPQFLECDSINTVDIQDHTNGTSHNPNSLADTNNLGNMQDYSFVDVKGEMQDFSMMDVQEWESPSSDWV